MKYGKMEASEGERCSNNGYGARFTTPCCYADLDGEADDCPDCGAPIRCTIEHEPVSVCTIRGGDDD